MGFFRSTSVTHVSRIELYCCSRIPPQHTFTHYQSSIKTLLSFNLRDSFVKRQISQHLDKWWHVYSRQKRPLSVQTRPISVFTHMLTHLSRCSIVPFHTWWHVDSLQKRSLSVQKRPISVLLICQDDLSLLSLRKFSVPLPFPSPAPFW